MNKRILQGKWRRLRGGLKMGWGRLTDDDRRQLDGKIDQMVGLFQERYGYTQERAAQAVTHYLGGYGQRRQSLSVDFADAWRPALSFVGLLSLGAVAWFFFKPFLVEQAESIAANMGVLETSTSPEAPFE